MSLEQKINVKKRAEVVAYLLGKLEEGVLQSNSDRDLCDAIFMYAGWEQPMRVDQRWPQIDRFWKYIVKRGKFMDEPKIPL